MAKSQEVYNFLKAYEAKLTKQYGEVLPNSEETELLVWGYEYALRLNPLLNNQLFELLTQFSHRNEELAKDESFELSNLVWKLKSL